MLRRLSKILSHEEQEKHAEALKTMTDHFLYVGSYTETPYAPSEAEHGVTIVRLRGNSLEVVGERPEKNVTFFHVAKDSRRLYAVSEANPPLSALHRYDIDSATGGLSGHVELKFPDSGACYISSLKEDDQVLLAIAFYDSGVVRTVHEDRNGHMHSHNPVTFTQKSEVVRDRQEAPHPHAVVPLESGDEFVVPDLGADALYKLRCHEEKTRIMHEIQLGPGTGPRHVLKHPEHPLLFVLNELANTLVVYEADGLLVQLTQTDEQCTLGNLEASFRVPDDSVQCAAHLQLSACGRFVLCSNRGRHNSVAVFRLSNPAEGKLELVCTVSSGGHFPRFFSLIDDRKLVVANQLSNNLLLFHFDDGQITGPVAQLDIPNPAAIAVL